MDIYEIITGCALSYILVGIGVERKTLSTLQRDRSHPVNLSLAVSLYVILGWPLALHLLRLEGVSIWKD